MIRRWIESQAWWDRIERQPDHGRLLALLIALALAGGLAIASATAIGVRHFTIDWHYVAGYGRQPDRGWSSFFGLWALTTVAPFIQGFVGACLLKLYSRPAQWLRSTAVAVVGTLPVYVSGLALVMLPGILIVAIAFLISCAWWGSGSRRLLGVADADVPDYVAVSLVGSGPLLMMLSASVPL